MLFKFHDQRKTWVVWFNFSFYVRRKVVESKKKMSCWSLPRGIWSYLNITGVGKLEVMLFDIMHMFFWLLHHWVIPPLCHIMKYAQIN